MAAGLQQLREAIQMFLEAEILSKDPEMRTKRDELALETGRAFADVLLRFEKEDGAELPGYQQQMSTLLKNYNAVNAEQQRRDIDVDAMRLFRGNNGGRR